MTDVVTRLETHRVMGINDDKLVIIEMRGTESLGRLFEFELDLISEDELVDGAQILGKNITVRLDMNDNKKRYFNGFVSRFTFTGVDDTRRDSRKIFYYRATIVPWTWFLTRVANCRIFQQKNIPDIIKQVCNDHGFTDLDIQLNGTYPAWDYCVQYRETDFNFISRLMENEGIYYYFTHEDGKHKMVLCDAHTAHTAASGYDALHFDEPDLKSTDDKFIWDWVLDHEVTSTKFSLQDYNMTTPKTDLARVKSTEHTHDSGKFEIFDYPGGYQTPDDGLKYALTRLQEADSEFVVGQATTSARGVFTGAIFTLDDHPALDPATYLITGASYQLRNDDVGLGLGRKSGPVFRAHLTCTPNSKEFKPRRLTPKPVVQGPQTAVVVGPNGEEIYTDKYGRVKVQFFWDREGKKDENSSCWIRVSQNWAGKNWGIIFNPRIGQEVIVEFLEGDPDRPIITGRVYNADQMPPYALPANQTQSTIKTRSSKGGDTANFNEIRFEDKKGSEQLFIHAEKNQDIEVENDETHWVGHDRQKTIDHDETTKVKHDRTETVDNNETITIHGSRTETVDKDESITINGSRTETVAKDETITINKNRTETVGEKEEISIGKDRSVTVGGGDTLTVGKTLSITAADEISLTTGDASIIMKKDGTIQIKGKDITITASGKITAKASSDMTLKGSSIKQN
ncbi:MAG TPA: type VI secretion system tip protein TssI/VgrG [Phycisphaerae bacterium]|jgi:type VI secretion system secreted protein VgrG|nr:type VI secretion system tip protein TssI/VgrG [Phycisphaerae bacterium]